MSDALFDISPYGGPPKPPRGRVIVKAPPESVAVSGPKWNGVSSKTPGILHHVVGQAVVRRRTGDVSAVVAACGAVVVPHTYADNEVRQGCLSCAAEVERYGPT